MKIWQHEVKGKSAKAKVNKIHATMRARTRYGIILNNLEYNNLVRRIKAKHGREVERKTAHRTVYDINYKGQIVRLVYDKWSDSIVTFLPLA